MDGLLLSLRIVAADLFFTRQLSSLGRALRTDEMRVEPAHHLSHIVRPIVFALETWAMES